ncbi:MAG TPA: serine hydrolase [Terriglobales bacterium]|nr:serine hydrolase [Terriglobales bacterium]
MLLGSFALGDEGEKRDPRFATVDNIIEQAVATGQIPGAVVLVGHKGEVVYRRAFGSRSLEPRREPMTLDTIFDLASLTKSIATAPSIMRMVQLGQIRLNDPVAHYLPEFGRNGKEEITIRQLLTHFSGLRDDIDLNPPWQGKQRAFELAFDEKPISPPGSQFHYSDTNYIVLGALVERLSGMSLKEYSEAHIFRVLHMAHTTFLPPQSWLPQIAPTQYDERGVMLRGVVHDPRARRMGGIAGHAGLFSTADDLSRFAQALLDGDKILSPEIIEKMTTPQQPANSTVLRGLGWDIDSPFASNRGDLLPIGSFGHTGFTGTSLWIDPLTQTYIMILSNAVHPRGGASTVSLRSRVATAVADALQLDVKDEDKAKLAAITGYNETLAGERRLTRRNGSVLTGIDVLEAQNFSSLRNSKSPTPRRIGVLTNQTGVDAQGRRTIDVLSQAPGIQLAAIFAPEHGATGQLDTTDVADSVDAATHVPIYSVYGATDALRHLSLDVLKNLDAVVIDLQDAGVRFYTYETTMGFFLESAAKAGIEVIVLDRPNPITGVVVQGPLADSAHLFFTSYHPVPVRHGMTMGELARMFNSERKIGARLTVVPMQGWLRGDWFDSTSVMWVNPSPNLRSLNEATLYPGVALVEGTNVSVGRGTDTPFEVLGAPWINSRQLAAYLNARDLAGIRFVPTTFTPTASNYANQLCQGVNMVVTDRNVVDTPEMGIELASALRTLYPNDYKIDRMIQILANQKAFDALVAGEDPRRIAEDWQDEVESFEKQRTPYLLYR